MALRMRVSSSSSAHCVNHSAHCFNISSLWRRKWARITSSKPLKKTKIISNFANSPFNTCWRHLWSFTKWYPVRKLWRETVLLLDLEVRCRSAHGSAYGWENFHLYNRHLSRFCVNNKKSEYIQPLGQTKTLLYDCKKVLESTLKRANTIKGHTKTSV